MKIEDLMQNFELYFQNFALNIGFVEISRNQKYL